MMKNTNDDTVKTYTIEDVEVISSTVYKSGIIIDSITRQPVTGILHFDIAGGRVWITNGYYHREDGPAYIDSIGISRFYLYDKHLTFEEYVKELNWTDEQIIEWKLTHG